MEIIFKFEKQDFSSIKKFAESYNSASKDGMANNFIIGPDVIEKRSVSGSKSFFIQEDGRGKLLFLGIFHLDCMYAESREKSHFILFNFESCKSFLQEIYISEIKSSIDRKKYPYCYGVRRSRPFDSIGLYDTDIEHRERYFEWHALAKKFGAELKTAAANGADAEQLRVLAGEEPRWNKYS